MCACLFKRLEKTMTVNLLPKLRWKSSLETKKGWLISYREIKPNNGISKKEIISTAEIFGLAIWCCVDFCGPYRAAVCDWCLNIEWIVGAIIPIILGRYFYYKKFL